MSLRLGFCGTGKWASKLKDSFMSVGGEPAAYCRSNMALEVYGWGERMTAGAMIMSPDIDALVLCAPPEVTTAVALECIKAGKPCMATKPLMLEEAPPIRAPFYVDFWRLYSEAYRHLKLRYQAGRADGHNLAIKLCGSGPYRTFPGTLDYGPHVLAYLEDLMQAVTRFHEDDEGNAPIGPKGSENIAVRGRSGMYAWRAAFGNGYPEGVRTIEAGGVTLIEADGNLTLQKFEGFDKPPTNLLVESKDSALKNFCGAFVSDVLEGCVENRLLRMSCSGMKHLRAMRALACKVGV